MSDAISFGRAAGSSGRHRDQSHGQGIDILNHDRFEGEIKRLQSESTPWWPTPPHPGEDAPNVVLVLLDDTGFSHFGCFGSDLATPHIDRLAAG
ncbi:MAG TPA: hypothetical protein VIC86_03670, partial [Acidimicrobiales bacterium]